MDIQCCKRRELSFLFLWPPWYARTYTHYFPYRWTILIYRGRWLLWVYCYVSPGPDSYWYLHLLIGNFLIIFKPYHIHIFYHLVDRFFATGTIRPSSDSVLLVSIATLHIAIKIRESAIIKLSTLAWFGRGALYALLHFACWYLCTNAIHVWNQSIIS